MLDTADCFSLSEHRRCNAIVSSVYERHGLWLLEYLLNFKILQLGNVKYGEIVNLQTGLHWLVDFSKTQVCPEKLDSSRVQCRPGQSVSRKP
jgi:hypothetical protein